MANYQREIREIRDKLKLGVKSVTVDGVSTVYDLDSLREQLKWYIANDDTERGLGRVRTPFVRADLSGGAYFGGGFNGTSP